MLVKQKFIFSRVFVVIILLNYAFGLLRHAVCITPPPPPHSPPIYAPPVWSIMINCWRRMKDDGSIPRTLRICILPLYSPSEVATGTGQIIRNKGLSSNVKPNLLRPRKTYFGNRPTVLIGISLEFSLFYLHSIAHVQIHRVRANNYG